MRKKYMKVTVAGLPKSGKTVLAEFIGAILADNGFDVLMETDEDEEVSDERQEAAVKALARSGMQVIVQEKDVQKRQFAPNGHKRNGHKTSRPPQRNYFTGNDETIQCNDCGNDFIFTAGEQEFFKEKNLDKAPRRCRGCRSKKKSKRNHADVAQW